MRMNRIGRLDFQTGLLERQVADLSFRGKTEKGEGDSRVSAMAGEMRRL